MSGTIEVRKDTRLLEPHEGECASITGLVRGSGCETEVAPRLVDGAEIQRLPASQGCRIGETQRERSAHLVEDGIAQMPLEVPHMAAQLLEQSPAPNCRSCTRIASVCA